MAECNVYVLYKVNSNHENINFRVITISWVYLLIRQYNGIPD